MNSKWQINRVGLIDFWYYDEEEFYFSEGRMLLRGSNGSGKSVTMQSFIPLLLDGNMRPERLDPFGSRARKMDNYLLEEDDGREERTGYLYMEMKRVECEEYLSLGIGLRARRNKKLESWYFCITDGRRIGKDLLLYKDVKNKIVCSRIELRNRIGDGGKVMESQNEYMQCVNRLLFGFETIEEYREMLELLIQLRTPKLSKEFKPSIINEILSGSLQTLSEEDLRPMSEAIENMDSLKTNLDSLNESIRAAKQIEHVYDQYNQVILYNKALLYVNAETEYKEVEKQGKQLEQEMAHCREALQKEEAQNQAWKQEQENLTLERASLGESDAVKLQEEKERVSSELADLQNHQKQKEVQEQEKKNAQRETEQKYKKQSQKNEMIRDEIESYLAEMEEELEEIPFDEFAFLKKELEEAPGQAYDFTSHMKLLEEYKKRVQDGRNVLLEEQHLQKRYDSALQELDDKRKEQEQAQKELTQSGKHLDEVKEELTEHIYQWERDNQKLHLAAETLQEISRKIDFYKKDSNYRDIQDLVRNEFDRKKEELHNLEVQQKRALQDAEVMAQKKQAELEEWKGKKEAEPERSEAVKKNRMYLDELGVPYVPFYQAVEFCSDLREEQISYLEEALLQMGILDALIVPDEYRELVLAHEVGCCDRYLFGDADKVKKNLARVLEVDWAADNILLYPIARRILDEIGDSPMENSNNTFVDEQGNYRLGVLEGTITKDYTARFIGMQARERYRKQKISELEQEYCVLEQEVAERKAECFQTQEAVRMLEREWSTFPTAKALNETVDEYAKLESVLDLLDTQLQKLKYAAAQERNQLNDLRLKVREICAKCYLTVRLDVFEAALNNLESYKNHLTEVRISQKSYQDGLELEQSYQESLEELSSDLDEILYDINRTQRKLQASQERLHSIEEQLKMTGGDEIQSRLAFCVRRLKKLSDLLMDSVRRQEQYNSQRKHLWEKQQENELSCQKKQEERNWLEQAFELELALGYVTMSWQQKDSLVIKARKIRDSLAGYCKDKRREDLLGSLQEAYQMNKAALAEYQTGMKPLFEDLSRGNISMKRLELVGKYRGNTIGLKELIQHICEDAEEQTKLLSDKDRELFEDILANTISKKIRTKIYASKRWVEKMNELMEGMQTSSGLKLSLRWKNKRAEKEEQLDTRELVELLQKDADIMTLGETEKLSRHFRSKIAEARKLSSDTSSMQSFHATMKEVLDYRKWFEFQLESQKSGERKKELTDRVFFTFSGGEKAMAMYVPLFSAVVAKYAGARPDAPRLISLDEAFAGVDEMNIKDMFRLMVELEFNFIINSQVLWGDCETVPALAIYQLIRPENVKYVTVIRYTWNGKQKILQC